MAGNYKVCFIKEALIRVGHDPQDIDTVIKNHNGDITYGNLVNQLEELKTKRKQEMLYENCYSMDNPMTSNNIDTVVILSDSDEYDDDDSVIILNKDKQKSFNFGNTVCYPLSEKQTSTTMKKEIEKESDKAQSPKQINQNSAVKVVKKVEISSNREKSSEVLSNHSKIATNSNKTKNVFAKNSVSSKANSEINEITLQTAFMDMPSSKDLKDWFSNHYKPVDDSTSAVYGKDVFANFCKYFKVPVYPALSEIFTSELASEVLSQTQYDDVILLYGQSGEISKICGLQALIKPSPVGHKPVSDSNLVKDWLSNTSFSSKTHLSTLDTDKHKDIDKNTSSQQPIKNGHQKSQQKQLAKPSSATTKKQQPDHQPFKQSSVSGFDMPSTSSSTLSLPRDDRVKKTYHSISKKDQSNKALLNLPQTNGNESLRPIVIDGSNVACDHGNGKTYSCRGIAICVNYFWLRGHRNITCFVPNFRKGLTGNPPISNREVLFDLEKQNICKFTPSRRVNGKEMICYDDRFILRLAASNGGVVVSNDQYRDLRAENPEWTRVIDHRLLMFTFVQDLFMPPDDPLGRNGPTLDQFLAFSYKDNIKKYANAPLMTQDSLHKEQKQHQNRISKYNVSSKTSIHSVELIPHQHTKQNNHDKVKTDLISLFPDQEPRIEQLITMHKAVKDPDMLTNLIIDLLTDS